MLGLDTAVWLCPSQLVKFSSRWYLCARKSPYALHPVSQKFPQCRLSNGSNVCLIDDSPLSSFVERPSSTSSFHASLLQVIDGVMFLALCPHVVSQAPHHFRSSKMQATHDSCFSHQSISSVVSFHYITSRAVPPQEFSLTHSSLGFLFHPSLCVCVCVCVYVCVCTRVCV